MGDSHPFSGVAVASIWSMATTRRDRWPPVQERRGELAEHESLSEQRSNSTFARGRGGRMKDEWRRLENGMARRRGLVDFGWGVLRLQGGGCTGSSRRQCLVLSRDHSKPKPRIDTNERKLPEKAGKVPERKFSLLREHRLSLESPDKWLDSCALAFIRGFLFCMVTA
jgi:hypothetical protein